MIVKHSLTHLHQNQVQLSFNIPDFQASVLGIIVLNNKPIQSQSLLYQVSVTVGGESQFMQRLEML